MTEQKLPQAGEYWQNDHSERVLIHGVTQTGAVMVEYESGYGSIIMSPAFLSYWNHVPDCTGWDWVPQTYPTLYETIDNPANTRVAYIRRDSKTTYTIVKKDGTETSGLSWEIEDDKRKKITEAEAKARLPPTISNCPDCGEFRGHGHEDVCPMAWVTQDRVPVRLSDEIRWDGKPHWEKVSEKGCVWRDKWKHGHIYEGHSLLVRCRRKDLPAVPVKTKIPLRVFTSKRIVEGTCNWWPTLFVSRDGSPAKEGQYIEVHGLNLYIEEK